MSTVEEKVRKRAYELWEQAGCPEGRSWEFWFSARAELHGEPAAEPPVYLAVEEQAVEEPVDNELDETAAAPADGVTARSAPRPKIARRS